MTLLAPQRRRRFRDPSVLLRMHAGMPLPNEATFARSSPATYFGADGILREAGPGVLRTEWLDGQTPAWLIEGARTNILADPATFGASGTAWSGVPGFDITEVAGVIEGRSGWLHANLGASGGRNRWQDAGVLSAGPETLSIIVEGVDATDTVWGIEDRDGGSAVGWVVRGSFNWATGVATVIDSQVGTSPRVRAVKLADAGPNGGAVWRLIVTGTPANPGHGRRLWIFPSGLTTNTETVILHHAQHEGGPFASSPIVAVGGARAYEQFAVPWEYAARRSVSLYARLRPQFSPANLDGAFPRVFDLGGSSPTESWLRSYFSGSSGGRVTLRLHDGSTSTDLILPLAPEADREIELLARVTVAADGMATGTIVASVKGGPETSATGPLGQMPAAWSRQALFVAGDTSTQTGFMRLRDLLVLDGADWTMDAVRRYLP